MQLHVLFLLLLLRLDILLSLWLLLEPVDGTKLGAFAFIILKVFFFFFVKRYMFKLCIYLL